MRITTKQKSILTVTLFTLTLTIASPSYGATQPEHVNINETQNQTLKTKNYAPPTIQRDEFIIEIAPLPQPKPSTSLPVNQSIGSHSSLLNAAIAQLGITQDCTAMVENALRAIGVNVGDLAPMDFARYGTRIPPEQAQAGDIMMRNSHVAIYAGNGIAIHGGFNGNTVQTTYDANPANYSIIVRL